MPKIEPDGNEDFRRTTATVMSSLAQENPNVAIINANRYFLADDGSVHYFNRRAFFYTDDDHLSDAGAELVRDEVSLIISTQGSVIRMEASLKQNRRKSDDSATNQKWKSIA